jgi:hypothetical protein
MIDTVMGIIGQRLNTAIDRGEWDDLPLDDAMEILEKYIKLDALRHGAPTETIRQEITGKVAVASVNVNVDRFNSDPGFQKLVSEYLKRSEQNNQEITRD